MHAHDIPDTPEIRSQMDAAMESTCARLGLDPHQVQAWEDGYRAHDDEGSTFEWWYFDMQLDDGATLVVTFSNKPHTEPHGPLQPSVLVIYRDAAGNRFSSNDAHPAAEFAASAAGCDVRIGPSTVSGDLVDYRLHIETAALVADLDLHRLAPSWRPGAGISYFDAKQEQYMGWVVAVPYGSVTGTITHEGQERAVSGSAYHDHNWGNELMSAMLDHWYWGRAHLGDYTVVYVRMTTKGILGFGAINLPTFLLVKGQEILTDDLLPLRLELGPEVPGPGHQSYPTRLRWTWRSDGGSVVLEVANPALIEALDMRDGQPGRRQPLVHLLEHPMYYDFTADATLTVDLKGIKETVTGHTLYEKMMFR